MFLSIYTYTVYTHNITPVHEGSIDWFYSHGIYQRTAKTWTLWTPKILMPLVVYTWVVHISQKLLVNKSFQSLLVKEVLASTRWCPCMHYILHSTVFLAMGQVVKNKEASSRTPLVSPHKQELMPSILHTKWPWNLQVSNEFLLTQCEVCGTGMGWGVGRDVTELTHAHRPYPEQLGPTIAVVL